MSALVGICVVHTHTNLRVAVRPTLNSEDPNVHRAV